MARSEDAIIADAVASWQRQLLDLSNANPLVSIARTTVSDAAIAANPTALPRASARSLRIATPAASELFQRLAIDVRALPIALPGETRDGAVRFAADAGESVERKLTSLRRIAAAARDEQGVQILFATFGLLRWRDAHADDGWRFAPLLLVPVTLERTPASGVTKLTPTGDSPLANDTLRARLAELRVRLAPPDDPGDLASVVADTRAAIAGLPGWAVLDVAEVGLFQYHKLPMHEYLGRNVHRVRDHALVRALAGVGEVRGLRPTDVPAITELDQTIPAAATHPLLDADASQRRAIAAAVTGLERAPGEGSLVIQGPPGTGKSQTIANIIAEALARGRSVLFVSEKRAALEVVARRLRDNGLGDHVIELHSHKANAADFLAQLQRSLNGLEGTLDGRHAVEADAARLDAQVAALANDAAILAGNRPPLGRSLYQVIGALASIDPDARAHWLVANMPATATLTWERLEEMCTIVERIAALGPTTGAGADVPWRHLSVASVSLTLRQDIAARLPKVAPVIREVLAAATVITRALGLPDPRTTQDLDRLATLAGASTHRPPTLPEWFEPGVLDRLRTLVARQRDAGSRRGALVEQVGGALSPQAETLDADAIEAALFHDALLRSLASDAESAIYLIVTRGDSCATRAIALADAAAEVQAAAQELAAAAGMSAPGRIADDGDLMRFLEIAAAGPAAAARWLSRPGIAEARDAISEASGRSAEHAALLASLAAAGFTPRLVDAASPDLLARRAKAGALSALSRSHRADTALIDACRRPGARPSDAVTTSALDKARQARSIAAWFANQQQPLEARIGVAVDLATDWEALLARMAPIDEALHIVGPDPSAAILTHLQAPVPDAGLIAARDRYRAATERLVVTRDAATAELPRIASGGSPLADLDGASLADLVATTREIADAIVGARAAFDRLRHSMPTSARVTPSAIRPMLAAIREVRSIDGELAEETTRSFGRLYTGPGTDWEHVEVVLNGVDAVRNLFPRGAVPAPVVELMCDSSGARRARVHFGEISHLRARVQSDIRWLSTFLAVERLAPAAGPSGAVDLEALATFCEDRIHRLGDLDRWLEANRLRDRAARLGIADAIAAIGMREAPPALWPDILRANLLLRWLSDMIEASPTIRGWSGEDHERRAIAFRQADLTHIGNTPVRVRQGIAARYEHRRRAVTPAEGALLRQELARTTRRLSPLALVARLPHLFPAIAPCLMMSPLSVATYLPDELEPFDLVVFDEASQVRPHDAIGAILRGRQVVVVGDDKQLPPTSYMEKAFSADGLDEDEDLDMLTGQESLLRALSGTAFGLQGGLASFTLRWHYRSRDEQLIAFSNAHYYDSALITLPAAARDGGPALTFVHCPDGRFIRRSDRADAPRGSDDRAGTNPVEAARIIELLRAHIARRPWRSLGIVTLNQTQADLVSDLVERAAATDSDLRAFLTADGLDPFFVKALEQVQGDERDDIILGIGFSRDADDRIRLYFGPIGQSGGERRLNVAITRARHRLVVVSSLLGSELRQRLDQGRSELSVATTRSLGELADFLTYAQDGHLAAPATRPEGGGSGTDPFPAAVAAFLRAAGHTVVERVGASSHALDLAVVDPADPGRYLLGIDIDGSVAMRAPTARDRERIRPGHLAALGWRTHRVDALGWERAPQRERDLLLAAIARSRPASPPPVTLA